uniref:DNA-directed RNA polymerase III subunit RPC5 n=2 Tax=Aegilops tauschii TaxID=37682 RepID=R7VYS7_AEGTA
METDRVSAGEGADLEGEDFVVREMDVYFTPRPFGKDTKLYIAQYPQRPCWRPYELGEACKEVRVRPESSEVEVDLEIDTESGNYDQEVSASPRLTEQTLSSSEAAADVAGYAVGVLRGGLLHLNRLDAVLQLRPSMSHLISGPSHTTRQPLQEVETNGLKVPSVKGDERSEGSNKDSIKEPEPWISLTYEPAGSDVASRYYAEMMANEGRPIMDFTMSTQDYAMSLCPGGPTGSKRTNRCEVLREMLSLPLEVRLKKWFTEVSQVNRFDALMHLAPDCSEEDLLKILPVYADLVRGLWVCKSSLLYDDGHASKRDRILLGFTKGESIPVKYVDRLIRDERTRNMILNPLGKRREKLNDYKFIVPADSSFIRRYSHIVKEQENACLEVIGSYPGAAKCSCVRLASASKVSVGIKYVALLADQELWAKLAISIQDLVPCMLLCSDSSLARSGKGYAGSGTTEKDGLFCERIFGPIKSGICACGNSRASGAENEDERFCQKCAGVDAARQLAPARPLRCRPLDVRDDPVALSLRRALLILDRSRSPYVGSSPTGRLPLFRVTPAETAHELPVLTLVPSL